MRAYFNNYTTIVYYIYIGIYTSAEEFRCGWEKSQYLKFKRGYYRQTQHRVTTADKRVMFNFDWSGAFNGQFNAAFNGQFNQQGAAPHARSDRPTPAASKRLLQNLVNSACIVNKI